MTLTVQKIRQTLMVALVCVGLLAGSGCADDKVSKGQLFTVGAGLIAGGLVGNMVGDGGMVPTLLGAGVGMFLGGVVYDLVAKNDKDERGHGYHHRHR